MCMYISPLLVLGVPEINIPDMLSKVYISIKYEPDTLFLWGTAIATIIAIAMLTITFVMNRNKMNETSTAE